MTILNDIANALENYPQDEVAISIVDVALHTGTLPVININEIWKFKVKLENSGHINMSAVSLHLAGLNGATVSISGPGGPFVTSPAAWGSLTVNGGGSQTSAYLYFKAPAVAKPAGTQLVTAHIGDWDGDWAHMFANHTNHAPLPEAAYAAQVLL